MYCGHENEFIKEMLSFLSDTDIFDVENSDEIDVNSSFILDSNSILHNSSISNDTILWSNPMKTNASVTESWSSSSSGSISSSKIFSSNIISDLESSHASLMLELESLLPDTFTNPPPEFELVPISASSPISRRRSTSGSERNFSFGFRENLLPSQSNVLCSFCYKNGEIPQVYRSHSVKTDNKIVTCPVLRKLVCYLCGATGDFAHTRRYCPLYDRQVENPRPTYRRLANGMLTSCHNHK